MEDKRIKAAKNWPELKSVRDIQVFLGFANFYHRFIQNFSKIAAPLTSILKTTKLCDRLALIAIGANVNKVINNSREPLLPKSKKMKMTKSKNLA